MDYIEIKGYKSIRDARIDIKPINILIGGNGCGKSNLLSFFEFLYHLYNQKLQVYVGMRGGIDKFIHKGKNPSDKIGGTLGYGNGQYTYTFEISRAGNSFVISKEVFINNGKKIESNDIRYEAQIKSITLTDGREIEDYIMCYRKYHFNNTGQNSPFNTTTNIGKDSRMLYENGDNIAAVLYRMKRDKPHIYDFIVYTIKRIARYFSDFVLEPNENGYVQLYWTSIHSPYEYDVTDLSDGTLRFIALTTLMLPPITVDTIILDEPELGLHPYAMALLGGLIRSSSRGGARMFVATQCSDLIGEFKPEDIITVDLIDGESEFKRLNHDELAIWLEDFRLEDLWKSSIIEEGQP